MIRIVDEVELQSCRNSARFRIDWQFTTKNARIKLKRLYPSIQVG